MKTVTCREIDTEVLMELTRRQSPYIVTFHGKPAAVLIPLPTKENLVQVSFAIRQLVQKDNLIDLVSDTLVVKSHQKPK